MGQHEHIMEDMEEHAATDPVDLLLESHHLLEIDFEALGKESLTVQQFWVAQIATADAVANHIKQEKT